MKNDLSQYRGKMCRDLEQVQKVVKNLKSHGQKVVLTSGTFDILHVGHGRYLSLARSYGDRLIVGIDGDEKVRARKGPHRPIVDETERTEMLSYLKAVDWLYIKPLTDPKWALIKAVRPDVLIISERSEYDGGKVTQLKKYCRSVIVLETQAESSTTGRIRKLIVSSVGPLLIQFQDLQQSVNAMRAKLEEITGGTT